MAGTRRAFYRPELDLLRFCAFGMVFFYHFMPEKLVQANHWTRALHDSCEQGVQVFFLLSAFLITELLLQEQERTGTIHIKAFYIRRILRIWPLYLLLVFGAAIATLIWPRADFSLTALLYFLLLAANWYVVKFGWIQSWIAPLWTISIEEQFYLLWPFVMRRFAARGLVLLSVALTLAAYASILLLGHAAAPEWSVRANSLVQFQFFAIGALLAIVLHGKRYQPSLLQRLGLLLFAAATSLVATGYFAVFSSPARTGLQLAGGYALIAVSASSLFLVLLNARLPQWTEPLVFLGRISYGLYALHFIAFALTATVSDRLRASGMSTLAASCLHFVAASLLCLALALLSNRFVEQPFLRLKRRFTFVASRDDAGTPQLRSTETVTT